MDGRAAGVAICHLMASSDDVSFRNTKTSSSCKSSIIQSNRTSPGSAPPLPYTSGFRLQPRKNIPTLTGQSPTASSSAFSRGRKRGAQTMVSALGNSSMGFPQDVFAASNSTFVNENNEAANSGLKALPRRRNESDPTFSPYPVYNAMQSMSIRSPNPSLHEKLLRDREAKSPFIVFSPSLKSCPYRPRPSSESFYSLDSSTKPSGSVATAPIRCAPLYGSPRRKSNCNTNLGNSCEFQFTPLSQCYGTNTSQTPDTPGSIRTLPSPHTTPLPRSIRLTPRSRRRREDVSSETSMFLAPNEKLDHPSEGNEGTSIFSFEDGMESRRKRATIRSSGFVSSPFSGSRASIVSRSGQAMSSFVEDSGGGSLRVETRSLLGAQDSTSSLDHIISSNARIEALDCDGSLSDDSNEPFVLANPSALAEERDAMTMPPPRPSRRRRISPARVAIPFDASTHEKCNDTTIQREIDLKNVDNSANPTACTTTRSQMNKNLGRHTLNSSCDLSQTQSGDAIKPTNKGRDRKFLGRLEPIDSCCSLMGLESADSSSSMTSPNTGPRTHPTKLDSFLDSTPPRTPSKASVRVSYLDIACMAVLHQQQSPTLAACKS
jgi:hypothetical protein